MQVLSDQIVFQEVPNEISISFFISGCPLKCEGCHSKIGDGKQKQGYSLNEQVFLEKIKKYNGMITCVLFLGGEWHNEELINYLKLARSNGLKTCLYTGLSDVNKDLKENLTYLKTGPYISVLGGLNSKKTNQKLIDLRNGNNLNYYFQK